MKAQCVVTILRKHLPITVIVMKTAYCFGGEDVQCSKIQKGADPWRRPDVISNPEMEDHATVRGVRICVVHCRFSGFVPEQRATSIGFQFARVIFGKKCFAAKQQLDCFAVLGNDIRPSRPFRR